MAVFYSCGASKPANRVIRLECNIAAKRLIMIVEN